LNGQWLCVRYRAGFAKGGRASVSREVYAIPGTTEPEYFETEAAARTQCVALQQVKARA
jgi:hypothetical protein